MIFFRRGTARRASIWLYAAVQVAKADPCGCALCGLVTPAGTQGKSQRLHEPHEKPRKINSESEFERAESAAKFISTKTNLRPDALVLGSGLGAFADEFERSTKIPYAKIPHFPRSTAIGHAEPTRRRQSRQNPRRRDTGPCVCSPKGYSAKDVAFPIRVFSRLGVKAVILTNAAGGIKREFVQNPSWS